jgi:hypothetical protein
MTALPIVTRRRARVDAEDAVGPLMAGSARNLRHEPGRRNVSYGQYVALAADRMRQQSIGQKETFNQAFTRTFERSLRPKLRASARYHVDRRSLPE